MKIIRNILIISLTLFALCFSNCREKTPEPTQKEIKTDFLINKTNGWSLKSISVPITSATTEGQWVDFKLLVSASTMSTSGHASGANAVWPSGGWTMDENGNAITRADGVVMSVLTLTATSFRVSFTAPEGTAINGRLASLDGDYIFDLE
jgi:hypothetical protein